MESRSRSKSKPTMGIDSSSTTIKHQPASLSPIRILLVVTCCSSLLFSYNIINVNAYVATYTGATKRIRPIHDVVRSSSSSPVILYNSNTNNDNNNDNNNVDIKQVDEKGLQQQKKNLFFAEVETNMSSTVLKTHADATDTFASINNNNNKIEIATTTEVTTIIAGNDAKFGDVMPLRKKNPSETADDAPKQSSAQFGDVMPLKRPSSSSSQQQSAQFGDVMPLRKPETKKKKQNAVDDVQLLKERKRRNVIVAIASVMLAIGNYAWQYTHPVTPIQLLVQMERSSSPLEVIGTNNKPSVVDFWAPWCENCRYMAPTLYQVEESYKDKVNFVSINGDDPKAWPLIEKFGVDAIPHLALVESDGTVDTALIGIVPKEYLTKDIDVLITNAAASSAEETTATATVAATVAASASSNTDDDANIIDTDAVTAATERQQQRRKPLPFQMLDVFANKSPEEHKVRF